MSFGTVERLSFKTFLPLDMHQAWSFFSDPRNLKVLTPPSLHLEIQSEEKLPQEIYEGMIICYQVQVLPFLKNRWVTEITHLEKHQYFIDEQRFGPYAFWHHQHLFSEDPKGVIMEDVVHYKVPGKILGDLLLSRYVRKELNKVFTYRAKTLEGLFKGSKLL